MILVGRCNPKGYSTSLPIRVVWFESGQFDCSRFGGPLSTEEKELKETHIARVDIRRDLRSF